jgi:hypothetical protein
MDLNVANIDVFGERDSNEAILVKDQIDLWKTVCAHCAAVTCCTREMFRN